MTLTAWSDDEVRELVRRNNPTAADPHALIGAVEAWANPVVPFSEHHSLVAIRELLAMHTEQESSRPVSLWGRHGARHKEG